MQDETAARNASLDANRAAGTRLELLLFELERPPMFGINVFKVQEVIAWRPLAQPAGRHPLVKGIATLRGKTMPIIDLSPAIGGPPASDPERCHIIITEYNRSVHGFLIRRVERIVNTRWDQVQKLPSHLGSNSYVTAITLIENRVVEILDVEKVLDQVVHASTKVSAALSQRDHRHGDRVLVVDDSSVARLQIQRALEQLDVECTLVNDGRRALDLIQGLLDQGVDVARHFAMLVSDIEMPEMDGYQLTESLRRDPRLRDLYILLHSSLSGVFNEDRVRQTGANKFIQKYHPDDLAQAVLERIGGDGG